MTERPYVFDIRIFEKTYNIWKDKFDEAGIRRPNLINCEDIYDPGNYCFPLHNCLRLKEHDIVSVTNNFDDIKVEIIFFERLQNFIVGKILKDINEYKENEEICFSFGNIYRIEIEEKKLTQRRKLYRKPEVKSNNLINKFNNLII